MEVHKGAEALSAAKSEVAMMKQWQQDIQVTHDMHSIMHAGAWLLALHALMHAMLV